MAKQFDVRKPIASIDVGKEKIKEIVDLRKDDWQESILATITSGNFDDWRNLAISGYQNTPAPTDWKDMHEIGLKIATYEMFTAGVSIGVDNWANKLKSDYVLKKWGIQYGGNKNVLDKTRELIKDDNIGSYVSTAPTRSRFQILCMQYGRKYIEERLKERTGVGTPDYSTIDSDFSSALVNKLGLPEDIASSVVNAIKQAGIQGGDYIYNQATAGGT